MRILTNVPKAELDYLANQPTAKEMIEKVKSEGIYIPEGDAQGAAEFVAMRKQQKQEASLEISDEGLEALKKQLEAKDTDKSSDEDKIKEQIIKLRKELAEIKGKPATSEKAKGAKEQKVNAIERQISMLSMQLIQLMKANSESNY